MTFSGTSFTPTYYFFCSHIFYFSDMFPASVEDVERALQLDRESRGVPVDSANWDMSEQLLALQSRKNAMTLYTEELFLGAQEAYSALCPGQRTPTDPVDLGNDLQLAKVHLREWRDSGDDGDDDGDEDGDEDEEDEDFDVFDD
jgi:hypothetical protein